MRIGCWEEKICLVSEGILEESKKGDQIRTFGTSFGTVEEKVRYVADLGVVVEGTKNGGNCSMRV